MKITTLAIIGAVGYGVYRLVKKPIGTTTIPTPETTAQIVDRSDQIRKRLQTLLQISDPTNSIIKFTQPKSITEKWYIYDGRNKQVIIEGYTLERILAFLNSTKFVPGSYQTVAWTSQSYNAG